MVELVTDTFTRTDLVLKRCNIDRDEIYEVVRREINVLQQFAGPYMVKLLGTEMVQKNRTCREALLLMEFYPGGHLMERLQQRQGQPLPIESSLRIFGQMCTALHALHSHRPPIIHRDLKLENVLFGTVRPSRSC